MGGATEADQTEVTSPGLTSPPDSCPDPCDSRRLPTSALLSRFGVGRILLVHQPTGRLHHVHQRLLPAFVQVGGDAGMAEYLPVGVDYRHTYLVVGHGCHPHSHSTRSPSRTRWFQA